MFHVGIAYITARTTNLVMYCPFMCQRTGMDIGDTVTNLSCLQSTIMLITEALSTGLKAVETSVQILKQE